MDTLLGFVDLLPPAVKSWIGGVVALGLIGWAALSKGAAERWGRLGGVARWVRGLRREAIERDRAVSERQIADLRTEIQRLDTELKELREEGSTLHRWHIWVVCWGREVELVAAQNGFRLPRFLTFEEWKDGGEPDYKK